MYFFSFLVVFFPILVFYFVFLVACCFYYIRCFFIFLCHFLLCCRLKIFYRFSIFCRFSFCCCSPTYCRFITYVFSSFNFTSPLSTSRVFWQSRVSLMLVTNWVISLVRTSSWLPIPSICVECLRQARVA